MDGQTASYHGTVVGIYDAVTVQVFVLGHTGLCIAFAYVVGNVTLQRVAAAALVKIIIFIGTFVDISVNHTHRLSYFGNIIGLTVEVLVKSGGTQQAGLIFGKFQYFIFIEGNIEITAPLEVFAVYVHGVQRQFNTVIAYFTDVFHGCQIT